MIKFSDIDIKAIAVILVLCLAAGVVIDYFSKFNWLTSGLVLYLALLVNGLVLSAEDREPGGLDHHENESIESKKSYKNSVIWHILFTCVVAALAAWSAW
jgi:hypothetical protein